MDLNRQGLLAVQELDQQRKALTGVDRVAAEQRRTVR
jgi:hypothetical protein